MKYGRFLLLLITTACWSQVHNTGNAKTRGPCSPAISGNNNRVTIESCGSVAHDKHALPPLVKQAVVSMLIPFDRGGLDPGIIGDENVHDPLFQTYNDLTSLGPMPTHFPPIPTGFSADGRPEWGSVSDAEASQFTKEVLRYYLLRSILELQNKRTYMSYSTERGATTTTTNPVVVPEPQQYPADQLQKLVSESKFGLKPFENKTLWSRYKLEIPKNAHIEIDDDRITVRRSNYFMLRFTVEPSGTNEGVLPVNFLPRAAPQKLSCFIFTVTMRFEWYRSYVDAQPYTDWAEGLFAGLEARFKQPSP